MRRASGRNMVTVCTAILGRSSATGRTISLNLPYGKILLADCPGKEYHTGDSFRQDFYAVASAMAGTPAWPALRHPADCRRRLPGRTQLFYCFFPSKVG